MSHPKEEAFERAIADWLVDSGGYRGPVKNDLRQGAVHDFDPVTGLDTAELVAFVRETQPERWSTLVERYGGDAADTYTRFTARVASELDKRGTVDVLRRGVKDHNVAIDLAYFAPAHGLTPELVAQYDANRLTVTRQLRFDPDSAKTLDVCVFVNGVPTATLELKNLLTDQGVDDAVAQYRKRDPKHAAFRRAVVHFAVDPLEAKMTTSLAGDATIFLPFNRGEGYGKGNPANPDGFATSYLWEQVLQRDAWLDLLSRFVHVEPKEKGSREPARVVFPRFHQWDAVRRLEAAARSEGPGHSYLVQHSAGSGKSNTIAWLAHRLSTLHKDDRKVFDKVVVITDRVVLDKQLQATVYQFEHAHGVVLRIDKDSKQLQDALAGEQARIIITTLQKFGVIAERAAAFPDRSYAIVVDEAHSSQSGDTVKALKRVLGDASASRADEGEPETPPDEVEERLADAVAARGRQPNLSWFAFTATPKGKTLNTFGRVDPATGKDEPFHLYSMRQAIEEGFIHDVLANYTTYQSYYRLEKQIEDDPKLETRKGRVAIARFAALHETALSQKAEIVVEHFRTHVAAKVGGMAKAMVVTSSRQHAVAFWRALRSYVTEHGIDLGVLVAFSGTVEFDGQQWTEAGCNGFAESQTAERFDSGTYRILVVAEKFQTGFDQPKLYAMYVDKTLTGLNAVQTLSRLNRTHPLKGGTFVLDFVNDASAIAAEFQRYHVRTVAPETDPNLLWDTRAALDEFGVLVVSDAAALADLLLQPNPNSKRVHQVLHPGLDRFKALEETERERFRDALTRFVRTYAFLAQIVSFGDADLERDYLYGKALLALLPTDGDIGRVDLSDALVLTHLRHEQTFAGSVSLGSEEGEVETVFAGTGPMRDEESEVLSKLVDSFNDRFGTDWTDADRLLLDAAAADLAADHGVQIAASTNTAENFGLVIPEQFKDALVERMDRNEKLVLSYLDSEEMQAEVLKAYVPLIYARARVGRQQHCPIGELLRPGGESKHLEYKSTLRTSWDTGEVLKALETATLKTIAAFSNSREGGTLLLGVADDGSVCGLEKDDASLKTSRDASDSFQQHLCNIVAVSMGPAVAAAITTEMLTVDGKDICRVHVPPSPYPVEAKVKVEKNGHLMEKVAFYVRGPNGTIELTTPEDRAKHSMGVWGAAGETR